MEQMASMENTDRSLIDAHRQGDKMAFAELVRRYGNSVLGYLTRMSGNREQADDYFQETFKRVHEKAHTLRGNQFKSWLFTIATHVAIDGLRRRRRLRAISLNQKTDCNDDNSEELGAVAVAENSCNPSDEAIMAEQKQQVRQAIGALPGEQRATLILAYYQQLKTLAQKLPDISGEVK
jgi:RNA polymerase sigma-70 factor (ECF subfamily)